MFNAIVIVFKCTPSVIRWINVYTFDLVDEFLFQCLEGKQIVTKDKAVVENIVISNTARRVIRLLLILKQNPWLQPCPVLFPDPS